MDAKRDSGCCTPAQPPPSFGDSVKLGERRRHRLIWFAALASALLLACGIMIPFMARSETGALVGQRLLWIAVLFGIPTLLRHARELLGTGRLPWQLLAAIAVLTVGVLGFPLVPATAVVMVLGNRALQPSYAG